ncbi:hypothetical protein I79_022866 [Cricetulus griseus]|uniref:Uncharacterized protein n=1 Tax=Cricetulus griseus TaxID=10029 RepID=G3IGF4_CRIGR|nr:hypothetical protein I79_022866 [Cricetulus griseus]
MAGGWNLAFISAKDPTSGSPAKRIRCWSLAVMNPILFRWQGAGITKDGICSS